MSRRTPSFRDHERLCYVLLERNTSSERWDSPGGTRRVFEFLVTAPIVSYVAAALTRARQARLPSPWKEAVDFLDLGPPANKKVEHWRARVLGRQRKSTDYGQGE